MTTPSVSEAYRRAVLAMVQALSVCKSGLHLALPEVSQDDFDSIVTLSGAAKTTEWCLSPDGPRCHDAAEWNVDGVRFTARGPLRRPGLRDWTQLREQPRSEK